MSFFHHVVRRIATPTAAALLSTPLRGQAAEPKFQLQFLVPTSDTIAVMAETRTATIPVATAYRSIRPQRRAGRAVIQLTYQWLGYDNSRTADTLWVDARDLAPIENHRHNGLHDAVTTFERSAAHTRFTPKRNVAQTADTTVADRLFASGELEELIRLSPLALGYASSLKLYYGPPGQLVRAASFRVVRSEVTKGRDGKSVDCWVVDAPLSEGLNTFYVAKSNRRVVRLVNHEDPSAAFVFTK